jgi:predicted cupin superfamily sugar epimerase
MMMKTQAERLIEQLNLKPLTVEGGYYRETYRSSECIEKTGLPDRYTGPRSYSTAIYYLLTPETCSTLHRLPSDEVFHFYQGDPVEMLQLNEDGTGTVLSLGCDIENGFLPQVVVPKDTWQGARLKDGGSYALFGTTVAPGFEFEDHVVGERAALIAVYPAFKSMIERLTTDTLTEQPDTF